MSAYKDEKQGTWYVIFRYIDWTGKKKQKMKRGFRTKKEAVKFENEFKRTVAADMDMQIGSFVEIYFEDKKNELKKSSVRNKKHMINKHILPYFAERKMNEITPAEIIQWQNTVHEKGLSKTYERMLQNQLNALFNHAERIYNLQKNPCKKVRRMGKADADRLDFWTKAEYDKFIASVDESDTHMMFEILFWTGIREGELLALTPADIDLENNLLHITKTYQRMDGKDVITVPKTDTSIRTITIPNFLKEEMKAYIYQHYGIPEEERLFPIVARTLQKRMKKYIRLSGVKEIRVHALRHSHVAYLIKQGVQPLIIKERLGHKDIKITLNTYGHLYPSQQKEIADMLDEKRKEEC
ncbi:MAG: site-specific integrase [Lachnospiraceae bacterium]|nr:site-specific integrase [Lachnospiraceae bacterium]MDY2628012.1 site-specific integrase [Lachnospiraceae bacterium]